jgi:O-antigen/teichoic acid export membrane protein
VSAADGAPGPADRAARSSLRANVRWGVLGNVVYSLAQWAQYAILARLGGVAVVGAYAYAVALAAPVLALAGLQLSVLMISDPRGAAAFREYRRLRLVTTGVAVAVIITISVVGGQWSALWPFLVPVCVMRAADTLAEIYHTVWQRAERLARPNAAMMLNGVSSLLFMAVAVSLGGGAPGAAIGSAMGSTLTLVFIHVSTVRDSRLRVALARGGPLPTWGALGRLAIQALPPGLIVLLAALHQNAPRYVIRHHSGDTALGIFAAASQLTSAGTLLMGALAAAATPRFVRLFHAGDRAGFFDLARRAALGCVALGGVGVLLSVVAGKVVLALVYRPEFAAGWSVLVVLSVAAAFSFPAALLGYALTAARMFAPQNRVLGAGLAMLVVACAVLVPWLGAVGAAWAIVAASAFHLAANAVAMRQLVFVPPVAAADMSPVSRAEQVAS